MVRCRNVEPRHVAQYTRVFFKDDKYIAKDDTVRRVYEIHVSRVRLSQGETRADLLTFGRVVRYTSRVSVTFVFYVVYNIRISIIACVSYVRVYTAFGFYYHVIFFHLFRFLHSVLNDLQPTRTHCVRYKRVTSPLLLLYYYYYKTIVRPWRGTARRAGSLTRFRGVIVIVVGVSRRVRFIKKKKKKY